jgi:hypothetical protein
MADEIDELKNRQQLIDKNLLLQSMESKQHRTRTAKSISKTCLTGALPSSPKNPNYSLTATSYGDSITLTFWRESCADKSGSALLVRAVPTKETPFFCSANFSIIQNSQQLNDIKIQSTPTSSSWCSDLFVASTMIVNQYEFGETQFNPSQAITIVYDSVKLNIPVAGTPVPSISGSTSGYKNYSITCKNTKTGVTKSFSSQTAIAWSCNGLSIKSGDSIQTIITGVVN